MAKTVMEVFEKTAKQYPSRPAMKHKVGGTWKATSWKDYYDETRLIARAFIKLGLEPGNGVSIIGFNCPLWFVADNAAIFAGGIPAGIYTTNSPEQCQYITDHCDAAIAVVENAEQLAKFKAVRDQLPKLKAIVLMNGSDDADDVHSWADMAKLAEEVPESTLEERISNQKADDCCTLIYTSGTTGQPKAVMISHHNISWTAEATMNILDARVGDQVLSYLPLSHIAEQMVSVHGPMLLAGCVWFAESIELLGDNLRECRPSFFLGVPRVWEKIQAKMVAKGSQNTGLKKKISAWARKVGLEAGYASQRGQSMPFTYGIADKLVYSKVREALGLDNARFCVTSAAPISKDTLEFFLSLGLPVLEIYGMSECTGPATVSLPHKYKTGKAGFCLPGGEMKIADDGEVLMRGNHIFMGYMKNEEATKETIDEEGWLHSGDIGTIDEDGFLQITDRKKELIITAGGENIAPQVIEGQLKSIGVVAQAVVIGDRRKYLSALFTLDPEQVGAVATAAGSPARDPAAAASCDAFKSHLQKQLDGVNAKLARVQTIKKWTIIPQEFTPEGGELTPTMKLKRRVVNEKYGDQIEAMYA